MGNNAKILINSKSCCLTVALMVKLCLNKAIVNYVAGESVIQIGRGEGDRTCKANLFKNRYI